MGSGESTQDISPQSRAEENPNRNNADIDFRFEDNPAMGESGVPPQYLLSDTNSTQELNEYPEMNFRQLADKISWSDTAPLTHGIHKHPAIFIPHIPRYLINTFSSEQNEDGNWPVILDPFCGSGTTGVEAKIAGRDFLGVEINPVSKLVSDVATTPIPYTVLRNTKDEIFQRLESTEETYYEEYDVDFLDQTKKSHWFEDSTIEGLTTIRKVVTEFLEDEVNLMAGIEPRERKVVADLDTDKLLETAVPKWLILLIANTVFDVSNADPEVSKAHKSKKMRKRIDNGEHPPNAIERYKEHLDRSVAKLIDLWNEVYRTNVPGGASQTVNIKGTTQSTLHSFSDNWLPLEENQSHKATSNIQLGDAREFEFPDYVEGVDMAITSPPYINAINYYRGTKLRLFWIHDLLEDTTDVDAETLRRSFIGTNSATISDIEKELPFMMNDQWDGTWDEYEETSLPELDDHILNIHNGDLTEAKSRAYITWKFFAEDMLETLTSVYQHLKPGAYFFFIIGENTISGRRIQSHKFVADIAQNLGKFNSQNKDIPTDAGYRLAGMAWDKITNRDLFYGRDHGNGVIEREWVVILQKPR
ncbi:DNA methyltransferase [Halorubrum sp. SY-15]|uniref:DNA methyltransferase n=1 Tax=Halorubrum sp. SY-15 TaxID=3402277 RepID=UPI003EBE2378